MRVYTGMYVCVCVCKYCIYMYCMYVLYVSFVYVLYLCYYIRPCVLYVYAFVDDCASLCLWFLCCVLNLDTWGDFCFDRLGHDRGVVPDTVRVLAFLVPC